MDSQHKNLTKLVTYTAGAAGSIAMSPMLNAALVIKPVNLTIPSGVNDYFRIDTFLDGAADFSFVDDALSNQDSLRVYSGTAGVYFDGENYGGVQLQMLYVDEAGSRAASNMDPGDTVTTASGTLTDNFVSVANFGRTFRNGFTEDTRDYTGFQLTIAARTHYGWLDFTANSDNTITFHRFAVQTSSSTGALVTVVPEPAHTAAVFAAGAAGLALLRRRKTNNTSAA